MKFSHNLPALLSGAVSVLAFSPFDYFWLVYFSVALLFWLWMKCSPKQAAWTGWFFGMGLLGIGTFWLHISIDQFGGVPMPVAMLLAVLFAMFMSLFYALAGWLSVSLSQRYSLSRVQVLLVVFPAIWTLSEVARGYFLTGFPWLSLGYSQTGSPVAAFAPITGVFGVSWLVVLISVSLVLLVGTIREKVFGLISGLMVVAIVSVSGFISWSEPSGEQFSVRMVQGNIPQKIKWEPAYLDSTIDLYSGLSFQEKTDLIIWPETAIPAFYHQVRESVMVPLQRRLELIKAEMVVGMPVRADDYGYFNSMVSLGTVHDRYDKRHLVPFGEYAPLDSILRPLVEYFRIPMSDFRSGEAEHSLMRVGKYQAGVSICYEDAFGDETAQALPDADFLINVSNDAWFGDSLAPHQHLQIARMRAIETSRYMLRATNTGISAIIDPEGQMLKQSAQGETAVIDGNIAPHQGMTLYARVKDWLIVLLVTGCLMGLLLYQRKPAIAVPSRQ
ncbi:MAG: apolipoprotein N-acyltransferase [Gammaproteobacteria bacterium]|nr:apolipoprotein N-acyltransferase [Gammaproteobacteria bacterium]